MANNAKGKAIYIGSEEEEWEKVLNNCYLLDLVLEGFGAEPIEEYGSYMKIPPKSRNQILTWLRKQDGYKEMLLGEDDEEEQNELKEESQQIMRNRLAKFNELSHRISDLEVVLKHLKDKKDSIEREMKRRKTGDDAEGGGCNY